MTPKVTVTIVVDVTQLLTRKGPQFIRGHCDLPYDHNGNNEWLEKVTGSLEVTVTYFMTPKDTMTFLVGLT